MEAGNLTKAATWRLGSRLSLAALLYAQDKDPDTGQSMTQAKSMAEGLGVTIKPFPAKSAKSSATMADVLHYLIKGDGASIGVALGKKFNKDHELLYEVSVKSNLLIVLYQPGDSLTKTISEVIKSRCEQIRLPSKLWRGLVTALNNRRPSEEIRDAVFKMHADVPDYFMAAT